MIAFLRTHAVLVAVVVLALGIVAAWLGAPTWCAVPTALAAGYLLYRFVRARGAL